MSKKRLGGCKPHWPNHGKSGVIFSFFPNHAKAEHAVLTLEINWRSYFDLLQLAPSMETAFPEVFGMNGAIYEHPSSAKHGKPRNSSFQASNQATTSTIG